MTETPRTFDPWIIPEQVVLVGCGGTGVQWARGIARLAYHLKRENKRVPRIHFIDPDVVELKNVGRQLFAPNDVGQHKAAVLALRFNYAYGLDIHWCCAGRAGAAAWPAQHRLWRGGQSRRAPGHRCGQPRAVD